MKRFSKILAFAFALAFVMVFSLNFIPSSAASATSIKLRIDGYTSNMTVVKGDKLAIFKIAQPLGSSTGGTICKSSNTKVIQIVPSSTSDAQYIKAVGAGTAVVTATAKNGSGASGLITIKVADKAQKAKSIKMTSLNADTGKGDTVIHKDQKLLLKVATTPAAASKKMTYTSSNPNVATVSNTGRVTGKNGGVATITAKTTDGSNKKASVKVTVTSFQGIKDRVMTAGESASVSEFFKVRPSSKAKFVTYTSDNESVLRVEDGNLVAVSAGTAKVTLRHEAAELEKTYKFTVNASDENAESITAENIAELHKDETVAINANVQPASASQDMTYEVADKTIASVDAGGNVTGKKRGTTTITIASVKNPSVTKTINVTVKEYLTEATFINSDETMEIVFGDFHWTAGNAADLNEKLQNLVVDMYNKLGVNAKYEMVRNNITYTIEVGQSGVVIKNQDGNPVDIETFVSNGETPSASIKVITPQRYISHFLKAMEEGNIDETLSYNGVVMSQVNFIGYDFKFGATNEVTIVYRPTGETNKYNFFVSNGTLYFRGDVTQDPIMTEKLANPNSDKCVFQDLQVGWY